MGCSLLLWVLMWFRHGSSHGPGLHQTPSRGSTWNAAGAGQTSDCKEGSVLANAGYWELWLQACHPDSLRSGRQVQCLAAFLYVRNSEWRSGFEGEW